MCSCQRARGRHSAGGVDMSSAERRVLGPEGSALARPEHAQAAPAPAGHPSASPAQGRPRGTPVPARGRIRNAHTASERFAGPDRPSGRFVTRGHSRCLLLGAGAKRCSHLLRGLSGVAPGAPLTALVGVRCANVLAGARAPARARARACIRACARTAMAATWSMRPLRLALQATCPARSRVATALCRAVLELCCARSRSILPSQTARHRFGG